MRYRKNYKQLPGSPDIAILKYRVAIFIDGEFWHGKDWDARKKKLKHNVEYWQTKIKENINRDIRVNNELNSLGWRVLRYWEKDILKNSDTVVKEIIGLISNLN